MSFESVVSGLEWFWKITPMMAWPSGWASSGGGQRGRRRGLDARGIRGPVDHVAELVRGMVAHARAGTAAERLGQEIYLPTQMLIYLLIGIVLMIAVSCSRGRRTRAVNRFYEVSANAGAGGRWSKPVHAPANIVPAPQNKLINHPDWEIQWPTRRGVMGFLIAWIPSGC